MAGATLAGYIRLVERTSTAPGDLSMALSPYFHHHPCLIAMWHGQFMLLPLIKPPHIPVHIILARHRDAEFMGAALRRFNLELIRGAGSNQREGDRGGSHAFRAALQALRDEITIGMTADMPPGPARRAGLGIVTIARMSGRPIVPVALATSHYHSFNTWSRMTLNLPFSKIGFCMGEPISVPRTCGTEELERLRKKVEDSLNEATAEAYRMAGADPSRATPGHGGEVPAPAGLALKTYRGITRLAQPAAPLLISSRQRKGKEDPARKGERLGQASRPRPEGPLAWFHAASVGETNAILPLMASLAQQQPALSFLLTTGTVTSAQLAAERLGSRAIHQYVPLDGPGFVSRFLDHWRPDIGIFTESEIWPNLILASSERKIPLALVNGRMSKASFRKWRNNRGLSKPLFSRFNLVLAQNELYATRFLQLGAPHVLTVGNLKIDAPPPPVDPRELARLQDLLQGRPLLIAASTHEGEDGQVLAAHRALRRHVPHLCTIIAPRHPERGAAITDLIRSQGLQATRRSLGEVPTADCDAYVADTIGELGLLYKLGPVAFIGGSLVQHGGQNPIEAIRHGAAVLTGPHWQNFADAYQSLLSSRGAIEVHSAEEIAAAARVLLEDTAELARMRERASAVLSKLAGALPKTIEALMGYLPGDEGLRRAS